MSRVSALGVAVTVAFLLPAAARAAEPARPIELSLDATEAPRKLLHARLVIPAARSTTCPA